MIRPYKGVWPSLGQLVFVDVSAQVIGDVGLEDDASVWMNTVVRGDIHRIRIGARTNVQDNCVLHVQQGEYPVTVEQDVTVGHSVTLHGCHVERCCLIGMGATILNGAHVGADSIVAAGSLVPEGMAVPSGTLVAGVPARVKRETSAADREQIRFSVANYLELKEVYLAEAAREGDRPEKGREGR
jgi:carbonic anhydrase/acetyltransferase-like protein (isoleucine patch superfamily)